MGERLIAPSERETPAIAGETRPASFGLALPAMWLTPHHETERNALHLPAYQAFPGSHRLAWIVHTASFRPQGPLAMVTSEFFEEQEKVVVHLRLFFQLGHYVVGDIKI